MRKRIAASLLPPPDDIRDHAQLADWLELKALLAADGSASMSDLERLLSTADIEEAVASDEPEDEMDAEHDKKEANETEQKDLLVESILDAVDAELERRHRSTGAAYPFDLATPDLVSRKSTTKNTALKEYPEYLFCLAVSYPRLPYSNAAPVLFEELSTLAAGAYVDGESVRFGFPRRKPMPESFAPAIDRLCELIGEGGGFDAKSGTGLDSKDGQLDVVAWRPFPDRRPGQTILFGQCTVGKNWSQTKPSELEPRHFCEMYFRVHPRAHPLKTVFLPHDLPDPAWERTKRWGNAIFFDRCRIACWATRSARRAEIQKLLANWLAQRLSAFQAN